MAEIYFLPAERITSREAFAVYVVLLTIYCTPLAFSSVAFVEKVT